MFTICQNEHRDFEMFDDLLEHQGGTRRHKCAGCAYELGRQHAYEGVACANGEWVLEELPESQARRVRHKDAYEAYLLGYRHGQADQ